MYSMGSADMANMHPLVDQDRHVVPLRGEIQVILGPMFSGKSTELLRRLRRYKIARHDCLVVKHAKDNRYDDASLATHDKQLCAAVAATKLADIRHLVDQYSVIGIDEGQFFPDVVEFSEEMANKRKTVIIAALDGTYKRTPFGRILELIPFAEKVEKLTAVCMICHVREASFTKRRGDETEIELIGGEEMYLAVCRSCHAKESCSPLKTPKRVPFTPLKSAKRTRSHSCDGGAAAAAPKTESNGDVPCMNLSFDQIDKHDAEGKRVESENHETS